MTLKWLGVLTFPSCCVVAPGLSGVYNIMDHYEHEQTRAVEFVSTMHKAMNGTENFPYYSPEHILNDFDKENLKRWDEPQHHQLI